MHYSFRTAAGDESSWGYFQESTIRGACLRPTIQGVVTLPVGGG